MFETPTLSNIKHYFRHMADRENYRHELIRRTIRKHVHRGDTPLEARYGTRHSLLARELRQEGIEVSTEIKSGVHWLDSQVIRKLRLGLEPTNLDYKKGFVCMMDYYDQGMLRTIIGKEKRITGKDWQWFTVVESTLMNKLSELQVNRIIKERNPRLIFTMNGLPEEPSRKQLREFLEKHSWHYRTKMKRRKK